MSDNKYKYFEVNTTQVVRATSKRDALAKAQRRSNIDAKVLATTVDGSRIPAATAHELMETFTA